MVEPVALTALAIEAAVGYPPSLYARVGHPVGGFARLIELAEAHWNHGDERRRRVLGLVAMLLLICGSAAGGWLLTWLACRAAGSTAWLLVALLAVPGLAQRSLHEHVAPIADALAAADLAAARVAVARIVGRDVNALDEAGVARAALESLAESFCDGIVAPACWLVVGGLPGLWAYKAVNTADSLIGHREPRYASFGWAAARTDDLLNLLPARLAAALLAVAGRGGWQVARRDARFHASPNGGWPEAALAGALGVRLGGPVSYDGVIACKAWLHPEGREPAAGDVTRGLAAYRMACLLLWALAGVVAWLR